MFGMSVSLVRLVAKVMTYSKSVNSRDSPRWKLKKSFPKSVSFCFFFPFFEICAISSFALRSKKDDAHEAAVGRELLFFAKE